MNFKDIELKDLVQTDITSFLRINSQKIITSDIFKELKTYSVKQLQKIARSHKIKKRSNMAKSELIDNILLYKKTDLTEAEWRKILGDEWIQLSDINCFINKKGSMIIGLMDSLKIISKVRNIDYNFELIKKQLEIEEVVDLSTRKESHIVTKYNHYFYDFILIGKGFQVLGKGLKLCQNNQGFLLLNNQKKFCLVAPMFF